MEAIKNSHRSRSESPKSTDGAIRVDSNYARSSEMNQRIGAIAPLMQLFDVKESRRFPHVLPDGTRAWTMTQAVAWCAERSHLSVRTIWRKIAAFKEKKSGAPQHIGRSDKGRSRFFTQHNKAAIFGAYLHLVLQPGARAVYGAIVRNRELLEVSETESPSYETVRVWLRSAPPAFVELALEGQRAYRELMFCDLERGLLAVRKDRSE